MSVQNRPIFVLGNDEQVEGIKAALSSLSFLDFKDSSNLAGATGSAHFVLAVCDFSDVSEMQVTSRKLGQLESITAHRLIYSASDAELDQQHMLFAVELGARFTAYGANRDSNLVEYFTRVMASDSIESSIGSLEEEIEACRQRKSVMGLKKIADQLAKLPKDNEDVLRLQAITFQHMGLFNKPVYYLRRILSINPQNLWAANELGRLYIRSDRVAEGVEVLEKLSQFHDLNSERMLNLGDAYLDAGRDRKAERVYEKGSKLVGENSDDTRFQEGLAKVKLAQGDVQSALGILGKPVLSDSVLQFVNVRAIMAIRSGQVEDGVRLYKLALDGCQEDKIVRSRLYFNLGLAYLKDNDDSAALESLEKSVELGGSAFDKASKPLSILKKRMAGEDVDDAEGGEDDYPEMELDESS